MKSATPLYAFELEKVHLNLDSILPIRSLKTPEKQFNRYAAVRDSIEEVGLVEPLVVYPDKIQSGKYILVDGHMRYAALRELKVATADCIVATQDEAYTYNARINRLSPIQEHQMIMKAVRNGVTPERIARSLKLKVEDIVARMNLLEGIHPDAVEILKVKAITAPAIAVLRKVISDRQIEMAELMESTNNYTLAYANALFMGTPPEQLAKGKKPVSKNGLSLKEIARMEREMESVEHDFKAVEADYGQNLLSFTMIRGYIRRLLGNKKIFKYLSTNHADLLVEVQSIASMETL